jgi:hypothetical protein
MPYPGPDVYRGGEGCCSNQGDLWNLLKYGKFGTSVLRNRVPLSYWQDNFESRDVIAL